MFNSIPTAIKNDLYLKSNDNFNKHVFGHLQQAHKTLSYYEKKYFKYNEHNLKIKPFLNLDIEFIIPVIIHINDKEFKYLIRFRILKDSTNSDVSFKMFCDKNETHNAEFFLWILENSWVLDKYGRSIKTGTGCSYKLNSSYNLNNIKNIKIRYGRFKILNFEIL